MFGIIRVAKARKSCVIALRPFVMRPQSVGPWPPQFWRDAFVVGFVAQIVVTIINVVTRGKLSSEQRGRVLLDVLNDVGCPSSIFMDRLSDLSQNRNAEFMEGGRNAETVLAYTMSHRAMPDDPDVAAAAQFAKSATLTGSVDRAEIGGSLMYMLFTQVVQQRLRAQLSA
jgi:hypothetical protein